MKEEEEWKAGRQVKGEGWERRSRSRLGSRGGGEE